MLIRTASVLLLCLGVASPLVAQEIPAWAAPVDPPPPPPAQFGPDLPDDPDPVPLDGLALLALAGTGYAVRRLRR